MKEDNPKKPTCKTQATLALSMELFVRQRPWLPSSIGPVLLLPMDFLLSLPPSSAFFCFNDSLNPCLLLFASNATESYQKEAHQTYMPIYIYIGIL